MGHYFSTARNRLRFDGPLAAAAVLLSCLQSWRLGLKWATRNARKALIESLSDSNEALFLTETKQRSQLVSERSAI